MRPGVARFARSLAVPVLFATTLRRRHRYATIIIDTETEIGDHQASPAPEMGDARRKRRRQVLAQE